MTDSGPLSKAAILAAMEDRASKRAAAGGATRRAKYFEEIPLPSLSWMALAPSWTLELAQACDFPVGEESIEKTLQRMLHSGIVEISRPLLLETLKSMSATYTMNEMRRSEVLDVIQNRPEQLREIMAVIGQRMLAATESTSSTTSDLQLPPPLKDWALLARTALNLPDLTEAFDGYVDQALKERDSAAVLNWIDTGRRIASVLTRDLDASINISLQQAARKLELLHRRERDERQLLFFLERKEQVKAFDELMKGDDTVWALHYMGAGAMGKTMLILHIAANLADRFGAAVAHIDFDYLNADYPSRSPGLLVWSFAQELRAYDPGTRATKNMDRADKQMRKLQQELQSNRQDTRGQTINDPHFRHEFQEVLALYIDAWRALSRPVILILDTCEELAKTRVPMEDVEATFNILRALHDGVEALDNPETASRGRGLPSLRVIFAGRQPLARAGYQWSCPSSRFPARPYLRLHQLRGFPHEEALHYLRDDLKVPEDLIPAVIGQSTPDGSDALHIDWIDKVDPNTNEHSGQDRCNPYILRLFADWAREEKPPSPEDLANTSDDKLVELRIISRLRRNPQESRLVELLPAVALLRHFDQKSLQEVSGVEKEELDSLFERLEEQVWVSRRLVSTNDGSDTLLVLDLEPGMQQRLLDYYSRQSSDLSQVWERATDYFERETLKRDLAAMDWSFFDTALRVFSAHPERGVAWWEKVNERFLSQRDFTWIANLTRVLTGPDGAVGLRDIHISAEKHDSDSPLRLDVLATQAAAFLHTNAKNDAASVWQEIAQKARGHPVPAVRVELQLRALAGSIATSDYANLELQSTQVQMLWQEAYRLDAFSLDAQVAAALIAATEVVVECVEELVPTDPSASSMLWLVSPTTEMAGSAAHQLGPVRLAELLQAPDLGKNARHPWQQPPEAIKGLRAFAATLAARALAVTGEYSQAQHWFLLAMSDFMESDAVDMSATWADWLPPDNLAARVRLEFIRASYPAQLSPSETLAAAGPWQGLPTTTDAERLRSVMLRLRIADGLVQDEIVFPEPTPGLTPFPATCFAHRETPPLFATLNELLAANGYVDEALPQLRLVSQQSTSFDLDTIRHAERALLHIIRRMRLRDERESGGSSLLSSGQVNDYLLLWTLDGLDGARNQGPIPDLPPMFTQEIDRLLLLHAIWRTRYTLNPEREVQARQWASTHLAAFQILVPIQGYALDFLLPSLYLDNRELAHINGEFPEHAVPLSPYLDPSTWWLEHQNLPVEALILWLRVQALEPLYRPTDSSIPQDLLSRIGRRRAAEIALGEGELLGLRLPEYALVMLELAATWFAACGDTVGALLARTSRAMILARWATGEAGRGTTANADNWQALRTELDKIKTLYVSNEMENPSTPKRQRRLQLPLWQVLTALGSTPDDKGLESLGPPGWRPWLIRLVACMIREERTRNPDSDAEQILEAWLKSHYGSTVGKGVELPADFAGWFARPSVDAQFQARDDPTESPTQGRMMTLGEPGPVEFSSFALYISLASPPVTVYQSSLTAIQTASLRLEILLAWQEQPYNSGLAYDGVCQTVGTAPYRMLANNLPKDLSSGLLLQVLSLAEKKPEMLIQIEPGLDGPCWEAALVLAAEVQLPVSGPSDFPFRFHRAGTGSRSPRTRNSWPVVRILSCAVNDVGQSVARSGWAPLFNDPLFTFEVHQPSILNEPTASLSDVSVLHLIGTAEETTSGTRWRFSDEEESLRRVFEQKDFSPIGEVNPSDLLVRAADLARLLPNMALCIIQGAVNQGLAREDTMLRGDSDRRDAMLARVFASELFAQGIPAVLVIPPLAPQSGVSALERVAAALQARSQPIRHALIDTLTSIQTLILTDADASTPPLPTLQPGGESEARWEQALDACLYLTSNFGISSSLITES